MTLIIEDEIIKKESGNMNTGFDYMTFDEKLIFSQEVGSKEELEKSNKTKQKYIVKQLIMQLKNGIISLNGTVKF
ncbi:MAG: hypothetical protein ACRCZH_02215 [Cetobacterium sp.]